MPSQLPSFLQELLRQEYGLQLLGGQRLTTGYVNVSFVLEVSEPPGQWFFLRQYRDSISPAEIDFEHSLIGYLKAKGLRVVAGVIPTRKGATYTRWPLPDQGERYFALFEFLPGEDRYRWDDPLCSREELAASAALLARFHALSWDWRPRGRRAEPPILELLPQIGRSLEQHAATTGDTPFDRHFQEHATWLQGQVAETLAGLQALRAETLPHGPIHCDYHPGNLKFQDSQIVGLFDFDWAKIDLRAFDVALAVVYFCTPWEGAQDGQLDLARLEAFLAAYQEQLAASEGLGAMGKAELQSLAELMRAATLYLVRWTVEDYYATGGDPEEYLVYLRHVVRLLRWLEGAENRAALEGVIGKC